MAKLEGSWNVLPHRPIEELAPNLWRVVGDLEDMPMKRVMTVVRRNDGTLVVHNAVALDDAGMSQIDAWGKVLASSSRAPFIGSMPKLSRSVTQKRDSLRRLSHDRKSRRS